MNSKVTGEGAAAADDDDVKKNSENQTKGEPEKIRKILNLKFFENLKI